MVLCRCPPLQKVLQTSREKSPRCARALVRSRNGFCCEFVRCDIRGQMKAPTCLEGLGDLKP